MDNEEIYEQTEFPSEENKVLNTDASGDNKADEEVKLEAPISDGSELPVGRALNKTKKKKTQAEEYPEEDTQESQERMSWEKAMRVLEAIMFANGDEVYYEQFAKIIGYPLKEAIKVVDAYAQMYDTEAFPRGVRFVKYEKCCQLTTYPELSEYVTQMVGIRGEPQLSPAAMETLAIVAYNQPVTRAYIEQVRRVDSTRPITALLDRELIEEKGRLDVIGRPRLFGTTQNFLRTFGITSLSELPSLDLFNIDG